MKRGWQAVCLCFIGLFAFAGWQATKLRLTDQLGPGPGFFPLVLALLGGLLSLILFVQVARESNFGPRFAELLPDRAATFRILAVLALLLAAAAALEPLGFRLTALMFTALLLLALGMRSIWTVPFVLAASFGVFHVFYHWLKVPLPIGQLGI